MRSSRVKVGLSGEPLQLFGAEPLLWSLHPEPLNAHCEALERAHPITAQSPGFEVQILAPLLCSCVAFGKLLNLSGPGLPHP